MHDLTVVPAVSETQWLEQTKCASCAHSARMRPRSEPHLHLSSTWFRWVCVVRCAWESDTLLSGLREAAIAAHAPAASAALKERRLQLASLHKARVWVHVLLFTRQACDSLDVAVIALGSCLKYSFCARVRKRELPSWQITIHCFQRSYFTALLTSAQYPRQTLCPMTFTSPKKTRSHTHTHRRWLPFARSCL